MDVLQLLCFMVRQWIKGTLSLILCVQTIFCVFPTEKWSGHVRLPLAYVWHEE